MLNNWTCEERFAQATRVDQLTGEITLECFYFFRCVYDFVRWLWSLFGLLFWWIFVVWEVCVFFIVLSLFLVGLYRRSLGILVSCGMCTQLRAQSLWFLVRVKAFFLFFPSRLFLFGFFFCPAKKWIYRKWKTKTKDKQDKNANKKEVELIFAVFLVWNSSLGPSLHTSCWEIAFHFTF